MKDPEIRYDEEAMHKVITNLLSNAIKFTPDNGEISVYIATLPTKESKEVLYLCVSDSGTGIPEQDIEADIQPLLPIKETSEVSCIWTNRYWHRVISL